MEYAMKVTGMRKSFGRHTAIKDVSFHVKKGEIFGLLGPSGSGKTTTIKILTGELGQSAGKVMVLGMDSSRIGTADFKSKVGILSLIHI